MYLFFLFSENSSLAHGHHRSTPYLCHGGPHATAVRSPPVSTQSSLSGHHFSEEFHFPAKPMEELAVMAMVKSEPGLYSPALVYPTSTSAYDAAATLSHLHAAAINHA